MMRKFPFSMDITHYSVVVYKALLLNTTFGTDSHSSKFYSDVLVSAGKKNWKRI